MYVYNNILDIRLQRIKFPFLFTIHIFKNNENV